MDAIFLPRREKIKGAKSHLFENWIALPKIDAAPGQTRQLYTAMCDSVQMYSGDSCNNFSKLTCSCSAHHHWKLSSLGLEDLIKVKDVYMEGNGRISVIKREQ